MIEQIFKIKVCGLLFLLVPAISFARILEPDPVDTDTSSLHSLFTGAGYGSNMVYLGSTISENQPYLYGSLTYGFNNEFYASFSIVHLNNNGSFPAFYSGTLNYSHVFSSWFDISAGLSAYKFNTAAADNFVDHFIFANFTLGVDWRLIYSQLSAGLLYSEKASPYFQIMNSRYFETREFFNGKFNISFDPYINFLLGEYYSAEGTSGTYAITPLPGKGLGRPDPPSTVYKEKFGLLEADIGIPVSFNFDRFTIEAEPGFVFPVYASQEYSGPKGFLFLLSGYFKIF